MRKDQVLNCMFSKWYHDFRSVTVRSRVIDLPNDVVKYLLSDGLVLPRGVADGMDCHLYNTTDSDDEVNWDSEVQAVEGPDFNQLNEKIKQCISQLGGSVIPKLNWSAPRDATWISFDKTMRCTCPADVFLLLKSSDFVTHDLTDPFRYCEDADNPFGQVTYQLILRRWQSIAAQDEFRCFVVDNNLVAISQRHHSIFFPSLEADRKNIANDIQSFYDSSIQERFPDDDYVFDVYRKSDGKVVLLDFNPFGALTDGLLFDWDELFKMKNDSEDLKKLEFRFVESETGIKPHPYRCYAIPQDFVHLTAGLDPAKFMDLLKLDIQRNDGNSSSEEDY